MKPADGLPCGAGQKRLNERAKQAERGLGENNMAGEPVHFVLMPSIHDIRLWHHDLIGQIADICCEY